MSETHILIRLLQMYIPRNWEFGPAFSKLRYFGGGGFEPAKPLRWVRQCCCPGTGLLNRYECGLKLVLMMHRASHPLFNPLAPSNPYMGRTAQLTSRCCILNASSTNTSTEYFKHAA
jgi:hypothetical protein